MVQVTAEVEGVATDVRFREGDRVGPGHGAPADRPRPLPAGGRARAGRARAVPGGAGPRRGRPEAPRGPGPERPPVGRGAEPLAGPRTRASAPPWRWRRPPSGSRSRTCSAPRCARRSPGIINTRTVDTGQFVRAGTVLATIVDSSRLRLRFKVSEAESLRADVGGSVTFRVAPLGPRDFTARIYHVGRIADTTTRQVEVLAWVDNPGELKPGFFAEVTLAGEERKQRPRVPEGAIQASEQGFVTYVVEDGKAPPAAHPAGPADGQRGRGDPLRPEAGRDGGDRGLRPAGRRDPGRGRHARTGRRRRTAGPRPAGRRRSRERP